jgi:predicted nucleic acid-binding protein
MLAFPLLSAIPEMHDRIIAGVAYRYGIPLLTKDRTIIDSGLIQTVW